MNRIFAVVPRSASPDYWNGWWKEIGSTPSFVILASRRTGSDANTDVSVLEGRLASGLHFLQGWNRDVRQAFNLAITADLGIDNELLEELLP